MPSAGWTNGDATAQETNEGDLHRGAFLQRLVAAAAANPSYDALKGVERVAGATAQQRPLLDAKLRARGGRPPARPRPCSTRSWPGTATTTARMPTAPSTRASRPSRRSRRAVERSLPPAAVRLLGQRGGSHPFDMGAAEAAAFHAASAGDLVGHRGRRGGGAAARFGSADPASWREPRKMYDVEVQGVAEKPQLKFYDRGTFTQAAELGP